MYALLFIWNFVSGLSTFITAYYVCLYIHARTGPPEFNPRSQIQRKETHMLPMRNVGLFHAALTSVYGWCYVFGLVSLSQLESARLISCAYLLYDFIQTWKTYDRQEYLQIQTERTGKAWLRNVTTTNPWGVLFHHVLTVMFMYGCFFDGDVTGTSTYFVGELPIFFLNLFWIYSYCGLSHTIECMIVHNLTVWSYAIIRIGCFAIVFLFAILPNIQFSNPVAYVYTFLLFLVWILNIVWFERLLERNKQHYPVECDPSKATSDMFFACFSCLPVC